MAQLPDDVDPTDSVALAKFRGCIDCVYGERKHDGTIRCTTTDRFADLTALDCCIPAAPLRERQRAAITFEQYVISTQVYLKRIKRASEYWRKHMNQEDLKEEV